MSWAWRGVAQVLLGLQRQLGSVEAAEMMMRYLQSIKMGFRIIDVTVTTHRVLSLIASLLIGATFAFGSTVIGVVLDDGDSATM